MSYKGVVNSFDDLDNIRIGKSTIWDWVIKFTRKVIPYVKYVKPRNIGDSWFADETMIKMHGKNRWLWAVIDEDTRYLLACNMTVNRTTQNATKLFYDAYLHAGRMPFTISTDKLQAYEGAFKKVFLRRFGSEKSYHLKSEGFRSPTNTNLIERWNEYIKQRSKVMRYFKRPDSAFTVLQGIIINYNYLWEHSTLKNKVPAQVAGINVEGLGIKNWGNLIDLAIQHSKEVKNPSEVVWYLDEMERMKGDVNPSISRDIEEKEYVVITSPHSYPNPSFHFQDNLSESVTKSILKNCKSCKGFINTVTDREKIDTNRVEGRNTKFRRDITKFLNTHNVKFLLDIHSFPENSEWSKYDIVLFLITGHTDFELLNYFSKMLQSRGYKVSIIEGSTDNDIVYTTHKIGIPALLIEVKESLNPETVGDDISKIIEVSP